MDTTHLEYTAEDFISHKLMQAQILVAKPKFDREGTDLLAFLEMADGVKFCRIQCKGRSVKKSKSSIEIPASYVTNGFVVFLYVECGPDDADLYCFLPSDIRTWPNNKSGKYELSLPKSSFRRKLQRCRFDASKIRLIRTLIEQAEASGEFRCLVYGQANIKVAPVKTEGLGTFLPPTGAG